MEFVILLIMCDKAILFQGRSTCTYHTTQFTYSRNNEQGKRQLTPSCNASLQKANFTNICIRVSLVMVTICLRNTLKIFSKCFINVYNCWYLVLHHLVGAWHYIKYYPFYVFLISFGLGICYLDWKTNCVSKFFFQMIYDKFDSFTMGKVVRMDSAKVMIQMD